MSGTITITWSESVENHAKMEIIGNRASSGYTFQQLKDCMKIFNEKKENCCQLIHLNEKAEYKELEEIEDAYILIVKNGVNINETTVTLNDIIQKSTTNWQETEWEFPKGRRNHKEKDLECALREFEEETGILQTKITIIENVLPFEEIYIGTNHKSYKHKYFLAYYSNDSLDDLNNYQIEEVSKLEWKTIDQCLESIRPYNLEKRKLITNINKVLQEYRLY